MLISIQAEQICLLITMAKAKKTYLLLIHTKLEELQKVSLKASDWPNARKKVRELKEQGLLPLTKGKKSYFFLRLVDKQGKIKQIDPREWIIRVVSFAVSVVFLILWNSPISKLIVFALFFMATIALMITYSLLFPY